MVTGIKLKKVKHQTCYYTKCMLPKSNQKYGWQIVCLILSLMYLAKDYSQFTMLSVALYLLPIVLDLWTIELEPRWLDIFRSGTALLDSLICILFAGGALAELLTDSGDSFTVVSTSIILAGYTISKKYVFLFAAVNLLIPIMFFVGAPNREAMEVVAEMRGVKDGE